MVIGCSGSIAIAPFCGTKAQVTLGCSIIALQRMWTLNVASLGLGEAVVNGDTVGGHR